MFLVTAEEMKALDERAIREAGVPEVLLMENAGSGAARAISEFYGVDTHPRVLVISGQGHNGGDGLVVARILHELGYEPVSWVIGSEAKLSATKLSTTKLSATYREKLELLRDRGIEPQFIATAELAEIAATTDFNDYDLIIDAIIGIGSRGKLRDPLPLLIEKLNQSRAKRVALDIATGLNADTGEVEDIAFKADLTTSFALAKYGHLLASGREYTGELLVIDIGIPPELVAEAQNSKPMLRLVTRELVADALPQRRLDSHKGSHGHALIIGGSRDMPGAPAMAAKAALRAGAGLLTMVTPDSIRPLIFSYLPEALLVGLADVDGGFLGQAELADFLQLKQKHTGICYGCGAGRWSQDRAVLELLIRETEGPLVIDADGLNALASDLTLLRERPGELILTPHPGEMGRLVGLSAAEVNARRVELAHDFAREWQVYLVLKGADTLLATPAGEIFLSQSGGPELAKGGTGDVLAGMITGLIAQGLNLTEAIYSAIYLHGLAGQLAKDGSASQSVLATDVIDQIGPAYRAVTDREL